MTLATIPDAKAIPGKNGADALMHADRECGAAMHRVVQKDR